MIRHLTTAALVPVLTVATPGANALPPAASHHHCATPDEENAGPRRAVEGQLDADRVELRFDGASPLLFWDAEIWLGNARHRLWFKSEGAYLPDEDGIDAAELQVLYSYAVGKFFNLQAGLRHDFAPLPSRTFGVLSVEGLDLALFKADAELFLSDRGDLSASIDVQYDFHLTRKLILQPRAELDFALQQVKRLSIGSGLNAIEISARLRYEALAELAPYVGVTWNRAVGNTAELVRAKGGSPDTVSFLAGLRIVY